MNRLDLIFATIPQDLAPGAAIPPVEITGITLDSRQIKPGMLFVATSGLNVDGHHFIADAVSRGASAVVGSQALATPLTVPYIQVTDPRSALAHLSAAFYDFPSRRMTIIGVTGTDGKTTTSTLLYHILLNAGLKAGLITTVNAVIGDEVLDTGFHVTTPESYEVQYYLSKMVQAGLEYVVLETTSHGLAQKRVEACNYDVGIITNITHEHLDFHGSFEEYRAVKSMLVRQLDSTSVKEKGNIRLAILNIDDPSYGYLCQASTGRVLSYGIENPQADFRATELQFSPAGTSFVVHHQGRRTAINSSLLGAYNVSNILAAFSAAVEGLRVDPLVAAQGIASMPEVPGRMERIDMGQDFTAIVDFAHTPNALLSALQTLRKISAGGRIWAVFGSAGLRDREKRRLMAEVSAQLADVTVLTAEDPRTESLDEILEMMTTAAVSQGAIEGQSLWRVPDRGAAIQFAVNHAARGDLVCAFGKGHEQSMCFGTTEYPWDDRTALRAALAQLLEIPGYPMPYLPTQDA